MYLLKICIGFGLVSVVDLINPIICTGVDEDARTQILIYNLALLLCEHHCT